MEYDLIGIHAPANGGKDTVTSYICEASARGVLGINTVYASYAFAKPIKEACQIMFGFTWEQMEDRILKEQVDPFWGFSPRFAMQKLGTEYGRDTLRKDVWIRRAEMEIAKNAKSNLGTIISDVRFDNEADWIRSQPNSLIIILEVPNLVKDAKYNHASEAGITRKESDLVIVNNKALGKSVLYQQIQSIFHPQKDLPL